MSVTLMSVWAADILKALGAPDTQNNINNLAAWQACEGGDSLQRNNPFNTTLPAPGSTTVNSAGVRGYPSFAAGLKATLSTLDGSAYSGIRSALKSNAPRAQFANAVGSSPWGTSGSCIATSGASAGKVAPSPGSPGAGSSVTTTAADTAGCLVSLPSIGIGPVNLAGGGCIVSKPEARAWLGGSLMLAGGGVLVVGLLVLTAFGFGAAGAGKSAGGAMEAVGAGLALVPGAELAGAGLAAAGHKTRQAGTASDAQRSARRQQRASDQREKGQARKDARQAEKAAPNPTVQPVTP
jgi:hypothetical protein